MPYTDRWGFGQCNKCQEEIRQNLAAKEAAKREARIEEIKEAILRAEKEST